jgi:hypothetical protein
LRCALILTAAFCALSASSAMAQGQLQQTAGPRYLGWAGRTTDTAARGPQSASVDGLRRPAAVIPHAGIGAPPLTVASANVSAPRTPDRVQRSGLTPASAWLSPEADAPAPTLPQPEYLPERPAPAPPAPQPVRAASTPPRPAPVEQPRTEQPAPAPVRALPEVPEFDPADPMAPRRDAPIFRMQQPGQPPAQPMPQPARAETQQPPQQAQVPQATSANTGQPTQTARYYSVHRPSGRQPDPVTLPDQVTLDELQLTELPTSTDLAEPQAGPTLMRNGEGRMVPVPDQDPQ